MRFISITRIWAQNAPLLWPLLFWVLLFTFYEHIDPYLRVSRCSFPQLPLLTDKNEWDANVADQLTDSAPISKLSQGASGFPAGSSSIAAKELPQTNILIVADPQLIDYHTYPGRSMPLMKLSQLTVDNYIYKNYRALLKNLQPNIVVFLGDLLDNGRNPESADYYQSQFLRFADLFVKTAYEHRGKRNKDGIQIITNVPGNHDIGYGQGITAESVERFESHFGKRNLVIEQPNHQLIFLNDLSISYDKSKALSDDLKRIYEEDVEFITQLGSHRKSKTRILFDHVTLWRDPSVQKCGSKRESKSNFPLTTGYQYQTALDKDTSDFLLKNISPDIIFSGDDHDYCEIISESTDNFDHTIHKSISINVKSISMAMGIYQPAVHLLTLYDQPVKIAHDFVVKGEILKERGRSMDYAYSMCELSKPYIDVIVYIAAAIGTVIWDIIICQKALGGKRLLKEDEIEDIDFSHSSTRKNGLIGLFTNLSCFKFFKTVAIQFIITLALYIIFTSR